MLAGEHDTLLLGGGHPAEKGGAFHLAAQRRRVHEREFRAGQHALDWQVQFRAQVLCHQFAVAGDDLDLHTA
ncbi:hypothetical protein G6F63_015875 [Rhizopus arrhizus]|nr:hypothetical protein G6F63_015875 [Rhizopus arrhizus]